MQKRVIGVLSILMAILVASAWILVAQIRKPKPPSNDEINEAIQSFNRARHSDQQYFDRWRWVSVLPRRIVYAVGSPLITTSSSDTVPAGTVLFPVELTKVCVNADSITSTRAKPRPKFDQDIEDVLSGKSLAPVQAQQQMAARDATQPANEIIGSNSVARSPILQQADAILAGAEIAPKTPFNDQSHWHTNYFENFPVGSITNSDVRLYYFYKNPMGKWEMWDSLIVFGNVRYY